MPTPDDVPSPGLDRRALIKRAAAVGAAAWTAPVVIGSVASPAAAGTGACFLYVYQVTAVDGYDCGGFNNLGLMGLQTTAQCASPSSITGVSTCTSFTRVTNAGTTPPGLSTPSVSVSPVSGGDPTQINSITFGPPSGASCNIVGYRVFGSAGADGSCQGAVSVALTSLPATTTSWATGDLAVSINGCGTSRSYRIYLLVQC